MKQGLKGRTIIFQASLFVLCCLLAYSIRCIVDAGTLGDLGTIGLEFGGLVLFIAATALVTAALYAAGSRIERVVLCVIPIALVIAGGIFIKTSYVDVSVSLYALTSRDDDTKTTMEVGPGGRDVRLTGSLNEGAGRRLATLLDTHPSVTRIHLTSDGGLVDEGDALRKVIADHRLTTFVPDYCVSACTLAFLGGHERFIMSGARLGFHAPFEQGLFGQMFEGETSTERALYISTGVAPDFVDKALAVDSADIWTPEADELTKAKVVTGVVDRYRFPDSNLDGMANLAGARATVLRNFPAAKALDGWRHHDVNAIAASYLASYRRGLSEGEATDDLKEIIGAAAEAAIINGDDETIVGYGRFLKEAMEAASSDADCASIGTDADLVQAEEVLDKGDGQGEQLAVALLTRALKSPQPSRGAQPRGEEDAASPVTIHGSCAAVRNFYQKALGMPRHDAATLIRSLAHRQAALAPDVVLRAN